MNEPVQHYSNDAQLAHQEVLLQKTYSLLAWSFLPAVAGALVSMVFNPLAMVGNYWVAVGAMFAYALLPFFLRYRACKAIGLRYKELKVSPITWLAIVLLLLAIGYVVWFGNQL